MYLCDPWKPEVETLDYIKLTLISLALSDDYSG